MAEETQGAQAPQEPENTPAPTELESKAASQGWVPKEEWSGDPEQWRPAKEFLDRGELFKKIDDQNRTIKEFQKTLNEFSKHHAKVRESEYKRAIEDLKAQKKEALIEGNADAVVDIDDKLELVREAQRSAPTPQVPAAPAESNPIFVNWVERNNWYHNQPAMRAYADRLGNELGSQGKSPNEILAEVEREVKKEFAHKFNNPNRDKPGAVEGSTNKGGGKRDTFTLSDDEHRVMQRFVKSGVMTKEAYIAELKKTRGA